MVQEVQEALEALEALLVVLESFVWRELLMFGVLLRSLRSLH